MHEVVRMSIEEEIVNALKSAGAEVGQWKEVSERPGRAPFAKELEYKVQDLMWGKVHLRLTGEIYVHVISKLPFNWKDRLKELKLSGEVVDAAGGLMWLQEQSPTDLLKDLEFLRDYLFKLKK
ncbi:MAG: succinate dehydrogenase subunit D [Candidatus Aramenus sulfurataquae]|uniref:Succinate dehydrogenase subunit D n=3 Tax=Candidatus Aramenus sulfurataquae TaxID=1326980 RepID=W7KKE1_9CREN|nr:MAG: succinate dehydrogenase subunit D [Candidatus Aramenus sulfurataquae]